MSLCVPQVVRRISKADWGGTETVVYQTARGLQRRGVQSEILATQALNTVTEEQWSGLTVKRFPHHYPYLGLSPRGRKALDRKGGNPYSFGLLRYLKACTPQLIHGHGMHRMAGWVRRAARYHGVPYVLSFHGGYAAVPTEEIEDMQHPVRGCFHYGRLLDPLLGLRREIEDAAGLICVNAEEAKRMQALYPEQQILHLPNGVAPIPQKVTPSGKRFRQRHGIPLDLPLVTCIGRIDPQKNQQGLFELLPALRESVGPVGLVCLGPVTDAAYADRLKQQADEHCWILPGETPDSQELLDAYAAAHVIVVPSRHEPFGLVAVEAWRQQKAVVASAVGGLKSLIDTGKNGVLATTPRELLNGLIHTLTTPKKASAYGQEGYLTWQTHYTWDQIIARLHTFYEQLINTHLTKGHNP